MTRNEIAVRPTAVSSTARIQGDPRAQLSVFGEEGLADLCFENTKIHADLRALCGNHELDPGCRDGQGQRGMKNDLFKGSGFWSWEAARSTMGTNFSRRSLYLEFFTTPTISNTISGSCGVASRRIRSPTGFAPFP